MKYLRFLLSLFIAFATVYSYGFHLMSMDSAALYWMLFAILAALLLLAEIQQSRAK
jgi:hypothetical protein